MRSGTKTSIYLKYDTSEKLEAAAKETGRDMSLSAAVNEATRLYAEVLQALADAPACFVRFSPQGWVVEPSTTPRQSPHRIS